MALDLDVEARLAEGRPQRIEPRARKIRAAGAERRVEGAGGAPGERDEAGRRFGDRLHRDARRLAERVVEVGPRGEAQKVAVAGLVLGEHHDAGRREDGARHRVGRLEGDRDLHPGDRLDAAACGLLREFQGAEQVVGVGQRQRRLPVSGRRLHEVADLQRPFEERVGRVDVEVDEADLPELTRHDGPCLGSLKDPASRLRSRWPMRLDRRYPPAMWPVGHTAPAVPIAHRIGARAIPQLATAPVSSPKAMNSSSPVKTIRFSIRFAPLEHEAIFVLVLFHVKCCLAVWPTNCCDVQSSSAPAYPAHRVSAPLTRRPPGSSRAIARAMIVPRSRTSRSRSS